MNGASDSLIGHLLGGRYEIISRLARGGMATVYRAQDRRLGRVVAIKVMHEGLGDDADFLRKFDREAKAAAKLAHPNIVAVFDQGIDDSRPYIVMELIEGQTLRHVIAKDAPLPPLQAFNLMEPVVSALAFAHDAGIIHRDIKPENVLISSRGHIKVGDFGLAKALTAQTSTATQGLLMGTVSYLPPELIQYGKPERASDIYSTGVVLFELLTGKKPYVGDVPITVAYMHTNNDVPAPSSALHLDPAYTNDSRRIIPPYVDALVQAMTRRQVDDRPADGRELLNRFRLARKALAQGVLDDYTLTERMDPIGWAKTHDDKPAAGTTVVSSTAPTVTVHKSLRTEIDPDPQRKGTAGVGIAGGAMSSGAASAWSASAGLSASAARMSAGGSSPLSQSTPVEYGDEVETSSSVDRLEGKNKGQGEIKGRRGKKSRTNSAGVYRRRRMAVLIALLTIALVGGISTGWWFTVGRYTWTPSLHNLTAEAASEIAAQNGLGIDFGEEYSETVPKGHVIRTDPESDSKVLKNSTIKAWISLGPERYAVPALAGKTLEEATAILQQNNLQTGNITREYSDTVAENVVVSAGTAEGTQVKRNTGIDLVVSKGPEPIPVTNYVGKATAEAKEALTGLGFVVNVTDAHSDTVAAGSVISQTPAEGTGKRGDTIELVNSLGPELVAVPKVAWQSEKKARAALEGAGFTVKVVYGSEEWLRLGVVSRTDPGAGKMAPKGSQITLYVV